MKKKSKALTVFDIKNAKAQDNAYWLYDGGGLVLEITPTGSKIWFSSYRINTKRKRITLGNFELMTLEEARFAAFEVRKDVSKGIDPLVVRKAAKREGRLGSTNTFQALGTEWLLHRKEEWSAKHATNMMQLFERDLFPKLGRFDVRVITSAQLFDVLKEIVDRKAIETAHRALQQCGALYRYAITTERAEKDITLALKGRLPPVKNKHMAAITEDTKLLGEVLWMMDQYHGDRVIRAALCMLPYVFVRPGELRHMKWEDLDMDAKEWRYISEKKALPHIVPLSVPVIALIEEMRIYNSASPYVFKGLREKNRPINENALCLALKSMGIDTQKTQSAHGFRATARTMLEEKLGFAPRVIEMQLAHTVKDHNGTAYNRVKYLEIRRPMMQAWADYLDGLKSNAVVVKEVA